MNRRPLPDLEGVKINLTNFAQDHLKHLYESYEAREELVTEITKDFHLPWYDVARIREDVNHMIADEAAQRFFGRMGK